MPRRYGEVPFTLTDLKIAAYNIQLATYGTGISLDEAQTLEISPVADNDQIKFSGRLAHLLSVTTHVEFKFSAAGLDFDILTVMIGAGVTSSGTTPTRGTKANVNADGIMLPYFGIIGKIASETGDLQIGLPVCMLDAVPSMKVDQNKFVMAETSGKGIGRESDNRALIFIGHETAAASSFTEIFA